MTPELARKLSRFPRTRWRNYFEVNRLVATIAMGETKTLTMSRDCMLEVMNPGGYRPVVRLFGKGKPVSRHVESLAGDRLMLLAGPAKNGTAWLLVIKRVEPR